MQRTEWTISQFGADVASVAAQLVLDDVILVGHSMGGPVALEGARQLEGRVKMIIGADTLNDVSITFPEEQLKGTLAAMKTDFRRTVEGLVRGSFFWLIPTPISLIALPPTWARPPQRLV